MWIEVSNQNARVVRASDEEKLWMHNYLSFENPSARYSRGPSHVRMFQMVTGTFPTGFLAMVVKAATESGIKVEIADQRVVPCLPDQAVDLAWLRDYQLTAVQRAVERVRGIWWIPTGGGKTESAIGIARLLPARWLLVVHRATLMEQAAERFELRTGETAGRIGEGLWDVRRFTCATFQTLYARLDQPACVSFLNSVQGLIVDEAHTLPADTFWKVVGKLPNAYWRIGMSGTPLARGDRRSILTIAATGSVIYRLRPEVLISAGVLARPTIRFTPVVQESECVTWQGVYSECVVHSPTRNRVLVQLLEKAAKPSLVFVKEIDHGRELLNLAQQRGLNAEFVWGSNENAVRMAAIKRLSRGDIDILICSVIFNEGIDIPDLASVVIGAGGKSVIAAIQRVGRGSRTGQDGKKMSFEVWDIADRGNKWLDRHTKQRLKAYAGEGYETIIDESASVTAPLPQPVGVRVVRP